LLTHEDGGMMGQFIVIDTAKKQEPNAVIDYVSNENDVLAYPNPSTGEIFIELLNDINVEEIQILNSIGENIETISKNQIKPKTKINISESGIYFVKIKTGNKILLKKIIVNKRL